MFEIPLQVMQVVDLLRAHTYTPYLVGDCVNALLLGENVMDFDIACDAHLDRICAIFDGKFKTREDLLYRGELIIINGGMGISVAPFRSRFDEKGAPIYCSSIDEDLRRRTFTADAIAINVETGIYDVYGGSECVSRDGVLLKAIDEKKYERLENTPPLRSNRKKPPEKVIIPSIAENPASILTAMYKHSAGDAQISPFTLKNMNDNPQLLDKLDRTFIMSELRRILLGRNVTETLTIFREIVFGLFPVLLEQLDYDQRSDYQEYTLYDHTVRAVGYAAPEFAVRFALLLHAIGKIDCAANRGEYNSYDGHGERAAMLARRLFETMPVDENTAEHVLFILRHHDDRINHDNLSSFTAEYGAENIRLLLLAQSANIRAKSSDPLNERISAALRQIADGITAPVREKAGRRTVTLSELKGIAENLSKNGI